VNCEFVYEKYRKPHFGQKGLCFRHEAKYDYKSQVANGYPLIYVKGL
tara:strand:- start:417 stop:557 length:141 start_codon:yes stop_codon:yes gene_type:complete